MTLTSSQLLCISSLHHNFLHGFNESSWICNGALATECLAKDSKHVIKTHDAQLLCHVFPKLKLFPASHLDFCVQIRVSLCCQYINFSHVHSDILVDIAIIKHQHDFSLFTQLVQDIFHNFDTLDLLHVAHKGVVHEDIFDRDKLVKHMCGVLELFIVVQICLLLLSIFHQILSSHILICELLIGTSLVRMREAT